MGTKRKPGNTLQINVGEGLTCKQIAEALGLASESSATKAWADVPRKFARCLLAYPAQTMLELSCAIQQMAVEQAVRQRRQAARDLARQLLELG